MREVARPSEDVRKVLEEKVFKLRPLAENIDSLRQRCRSFEDKEATYLSTEASLQDEIDIFSANFESARFERISFCLLRKVHGPYI